MRFNSWTSSVRAEVFVAGQLPSFGFFLLIVECCVDYGRDSFEAGAPGFSLTFFPIVSCCV